MHNYLARAAASAIACQARVHSGELGNGGPVVSASSTWTANSARIARTTIVHTSITREEAHAEGERRRCIVRRGKAAPGDVRLCRRERIAAQEQGLKYVQNLYEAGLETTKYQTESATHMAEILAEQAQQQREAFQKLAERSIQSYMDALRTALSTYEKQA
jgi:hypothetical protein